MLADSGGRPKGLLLPNTLNIFGDTRLRGAQPSERIRHTIAKGVGSFFTEPLLAPMQPAVRWHLEGNGAESGKTSVADSWTGEFGTKCPWPALTPARDNAKLERDAKASRKPTERG